MTKKLYEVSGFTTHNEWFVAFCIFNDINSITGYFRVMGMFPQNILKLREVGNNLNECIVEIKRFDNESLLNLLY